MKIMSFAVMMFACISFNIIPVIAADFTLGIFGNANMDETISDDDITYIRGIIEGTNEATKLADANYDGQINEDDITQIELIISGEEKELTIVDGNGEAVTVRKPVERIIVEFVDHAELIRILDAEDKIAGVTNYIIQNENLFPELSGLPFVGNVYPGEPDYEAILSLDPDIYPVFSTYGIEEKIKNLPGVPVIFLGLYYPDLSNPEGSGFADAVRKLGYILDRKNEAEEYIHWRIGWIDEIESRTEGLSDGEKPRVFTCHYQQGTNTFKSVPKIDTLSQMVQIAGGNNIAEELPEFANAEGFYLTIDPEWVIEQNPEFIFVHDARKPYGYDLHNLTRMKEARDEIMNRPELADVAAVKTGNVYILNAIFRNDISGGVTGAAYIVKLLHPDLFEDLDPEAIHNEYLALQNFYYDLDEDGVFVYPPIEVNGGLAGIPDRYKVEDVENTNT